MAVLRMGEILKMDKKARETKMNELRLELVRGQASSSRTPAKTKEIKKAIARLLTFAQTEKSGRKHLNKTWR